MTWNSPKTKNASSTSPIESGARHSPQTKNASSTSPIESGARPILVSACLAGVPCRYDGRHCVLASVVELVRSRRALPACPEHLGGLGCPHPACEIQGGGGDAVLDGLARVADQEGRDVTSYYLRGAQRLAEIAKRHGCREAWLKSKSPACGCGLIYNGRFSNELAPGDGVATALLKRMGIVVRSQEAVPSAEKP